MLAVKPVREAENHSLQEDSKYAAAAPRLELPDEISAEDELFAEASRHGERQKYGEFDSGLRGDIRDRTSDAASNQMRQKSHQRDRHHNKSDGKSQIFEKRAGCLPA